MHNHGHIELKAESPHAEEPAGEEQDCSTCYVLLCNKLVMDYFLTNYLKISDFKKHKHIIYSEILNCSGSV